MASDFVSLKRFDETNLLHLRRQLVDRVRAKVIQIQQHPSGIGEHCGAQKQIPRDVLLEIFKCSQCVCWPSIYDKLGGPRRDDLKTGKVAVIASRLLHYFRFRSKKPKQLIEFSFDPWHSQRGGSVPICQAEKTKIIGVIVERRTLYWFQSNFSQYSTGYIGCRRFRQSIATNPQVFSLWKQSTKKANQRINKVEFPEWII